MPIDAAWKSLYPDNWDEISEEIREQVKCCEWCGAPNRETIVRLVDGAGEWAVMDEDLAYVFGLEDCWRNANGQPVTVSYEDSDDLKALEVVLTVAHLDQDPRNCDRSNLRALCQRCHLTHDKQPEQRRRRKMLRAELLDGQESLFGEVGQ